MKLHKIKAEDLIFSGNIEDDRTNTFLELDDYDWMNYSLRTRFRTEDIGIINVKFEYYGFVTSRMIVTRPNSDIEIIYEYTTDIFIKHITEYMQNHIQSWEDKYSFNGEDEVISFFNDVLENGVIVNG